jgi:hypothetical protein
MPFNLGGFPSVIFALMTGNLDRKQVYHHAKLQIKIFALIIPQQDFLQKLDMSHNTRIQDVVFNKK